MTAFTATATASVCCMLALTFVSIISSDTNHDLTRVTAVNNQVDQTVIEQPLTNSDLFALSGLSAYTQQLDSLPNIALGSAFSNFSSAKNASTVPSTASLCSIPSTPPSAVRNVPYQTGSYNGPTTKCAPGQVPRIISLTISTDTAALQFVTAPG